MTQTVRFAHFNGAAKPGMPRPGCAWCLLLPSCIWALVKWSRKKPTSPEPPSKLCRWGLLSKKGTCRDARFEWATATQPLIPKRHFHVLLEHMWSAVPEVDPHLPSVCIAPTPHRCSSKCLLGSAAFPTRVVMEQTGGPVSPGAVSVLAHGTCPVLVLRPALKQQDACTEMSYWECLLNCVQRLVVVG